MVLDQGPPQTLGSEAPRLEFGEEDRRRVLLDDEPAFELSFWCDTCPFLFERLEGAKETLSLDAAADRLATGVNALDGEIVETFAALLPRRRGPPLRVRRTDLTHFLLDGHHKLQAAAESDRPLRLLALVSLEGSLATADQLARIATLRNRRPAVRG